MQIFKKNDKHIKRWSRGEGAAPDGGAVETGEGRAPAGNGSHGCRWGLGHGSQGVGSGGF